MLSRWYLCLFALLLVSCTRPVYQEQGWASYIADHYAGHMTSSGQPYYPQAYTAAHNSLPFGTEITVKNLYTGRSVKATVNDRFPYYPGRVVNLSGAAAQYIGIPLRQLSQVQVTAFKLPNTGGGYAQPQQQAYAPPQQTYMPQQQAYAPPQQSYAQPGYSPPPAYNNQPPAANYGPPPQAAYNQGAPTYSPQPATPKYTAPKYTAPKPSYQPPVGGAPNAPGFNGGGGPPPGLKTF